MFFSQSLLFFLIKVFVLCRHKTASTNCCFYKPVPLQIFIRLLDGNDTKSTTINAILDLIHKDEGTVTFWGQELSGSKQLKEDIGVVFDGINFYETLTPAKVGKIGRTAYKQWDAHLYQEYLKSSRISSIVASSTTAFLYFLLAFSLSATRTFHW